MDFPKISIVTPNFNQVSFIEKTICSVLDQGYPNLEYIIIDGGSTDGSVDIIRKYEQKLKYWVSEPDQGLYDAVNKGFSKATGDVLAWINSDDVFMSGTLDSVAQIFHDYPEIQWLTGNPACINETGKMVSSFLAADCTRDEFLNAEVKWIQQESTFWRRSLWEEKGPIDLNYGLAGDYYLWTRFFENTPPTTVMTGLGAFRYRKAGQKTLEQRDQYTLEIETIRDLAKLYDGDRELHQLHKKLKALKKIPGLTRLLSLQSKWVELKKTILKQPDQLVYDRTADKFVYRRKDMEYLRI
ncbi:MAG: glycosyltransferase family 2 protein [Bacteroidota bacterium]